MKVFACVLSLATLCYAQNKIQSPIPIPILKLDSEGPNPEGSYKWSYETGNGITAEEQGELKNPGNEETEAMEVRGSYEYTAPDGTLISVSYIANENGFQPTGTRVLVPGQKDGKSVQQRAANGKHNFQEQKQKSKTAKANGKQKDSDIYVINSATASFFKPVHRAKKEKQFVTTYKKAKY